MSFVTMPSAAVRPGTIATIIVGVLMCSAFLAWGTWRFSKSAERAERDPRFRRRVLLRGGLLYAVCAVYSIAQVAIGDLPIQSLIGLPIGAALAWFYIRSALRVKIP